MGPIRGARARCDNRRLSRGGLPSAHDSSPMAFAPLNIILMSWRPALGKIHEQRHTRHRREIPGVSGSLPFAALPLQPVLASHPPAKQRLRGKRQNHGETRIAWAHSGWPLYRRRKRLRTGWVDPLIPAGSTNTCVLLEPLHLPFLSFSSDSPLPAFCNCCHSLLSFCSFHSLVHSNYSLFTSQRFALVGSSFSALQ